VLNIISFTKQKNGGQGNQNIQLANESIQYEYKAGDMIKIYELTQNQDAVLIYTGYIDDIQEEYKNELILTLSVIGLASDLKNKLARIS
jgi:hypothetical protein